MPVLPWKRLGGTEHDRGYVVVATYIPVRHLAKLPQFALNVRKIRKQLNATDGIVGYALLAKPFRSDYWTVSAWEDKDAPHKFAQTEPHRSIARQITSFAESGFHIQAWIAKGNELPPTWGEVLNRLTT
jgi:heme-degrading monooxygenase HmoA